MQSKSVGLRWMVFLFFVFPLLAQAQRLGYRDLPVSGTQQVLLDLGEGEQLVFPEGWQEGQALSILQTLEAGYVLGNNSKSDVEHGQVYPFDAMQKITGVYLGVQTLGQVSGEVRIKVRQFSRLPGRLIGEAVWSLDSLENGVHWKQMSFSKPVMGKGMVIISLDVSGVTSGYIGLLSQRTDTDRIWTKTAERKWHPQETLWNKPAVMAAMWPVVQLRSDFAGGSGTLEDPYQVASAEQLNAVREYLSSHFIQVADIDLAQDPWNTGEGWMPIGGETPFSGMYNGGGYTISGLTIDRPESDYQGLFGRVSGARLWNLALEMADVRGRDYTGALIGMALSSELQSIQVDGKIEGNQYVGGICGAMYRSKIDQSESAAEVTGHSFVGGLAGTGEAHACTSGGAVSAAVEGHRVGGLLGEGFAMNSVASGSVSGGSEVGGLIGRGEAYGSRASGAVQGSGDYVGGLIGELATGTSADDDGVYGPGETSPGDTTRLKDSLQIPGSGRIEIVLEDGTRFVMEGNGSEMTAEAGRGPVDIAISNYVPESAGFRVTGSIRTLEVRGSGDPVGIKPIISIPMEEIGSVNPETVVILRIGDLGIDGELLEDYGTVLPVIRIEDNKLKFVDALFPDCVLAEEGLGQTPDSRVDSWVGNVKYALLTFDKALNWSKRPELERMVPDTMKSDDGFRKLWRRSTKKEQTKLRTQPICNIVLLVHGHNELEKDGFLPSVIDEPWGIGYKRLVWDLLYEEFAKGGSQDLPEECTAFYEFIYPTYRPIFSPVLEKSGFRIPTLGEDLGRMVNERLLGDEQIKKMLDEGMTFNLYVVAHSQGGLVSRAGLRFMDERLLERLRKVVTWGSPHGGAGLYSLLYALAVGHDIVINGIRFPLQNIGQSKGYKNEIASIAMDAPGIRDLRWDVSKKELLRLGELLRENTATLNEFKDTELPYGSLFYSENLKLFNETEGQWSGNLLQNKYLFYQGITPKIAPIESTSAWIFWELHKFKSDATPIEKGAQLNRLVMNDPHKDSDGAAPLSSQGGQYIFSGGGVERRLFQDIDHEEFYGSEAPQRDETTKNKGRMIAKETFTDLGLTLPRSKCPVLEFEEKDNPDTLILEGEIVFPIYSVAEGGDGKPGKRISRMEARLDAKDAPGLPNAMFTIEENGEIRFTIPSAEIPSSIDTLYIVAILKDNSEVYFGMDYEGKAKVYNKTWKKWYATITTATEQAREGDTILVNPGVYKEFPIINFKNLLVKSVDGAEQTILDGQGGGTGFRLNNNNSIIEGFTIQNYWNGIFLREFGENTTAFQPTVRDCIIQNNDGTGIGINENCAPVIERNKIVSNKYYGLDIEKLVSSDANPVIIRNNVIEDHDRGIRIRGEHTAVVEQNQFVAGGTGIEILAKSGVDIIKNSFRVNGDAIRIYFTSGFHPVSIIENTIDNCSTGISADASGTISIRNNSLTNNQRGMYLELGNNGSGEVNVLNNTITGSSLGGGLTVGPGTNSSGFQCSIIGNKIVGNINEWGGTGGGIKCWTGNVGTITISENEIEGNTAQNGGGLQLDGSITVKNNQIKNNQSLFNGAGLSVGNFYSGQVVIQDNLFEGNSAGNDGGAIYSAATPDISGNQFISNYAAQKGGAIYGKASNWNATETVTVQGMPRVVPRHVPCFNEGSNTYSGNTHGVPGGEWGPGTDNWCPDAGFNVYSN
jgi:predicted outer membrane repeat protein